MRLLPEMTVQRGAEYLLGSNRGGVAMGAKISRTSLLLPALTLVLLYEVSGPRRWSESPIEWSIQSPVDKQKPTLTEAGAQKPDDPEVKAVRNKMSAAGITRPSTVADVRKAYLFYPKLSGIPEPVFHIEDRQIPGPAGNITVRVYTPNATSGLPLFLFFHGGGFVAGSLDTYDNPLRSVANRCECVVVSVAYRLAPENKYPAALEDAYAATKWVAEHAGIIGGEPHRIAVGGDGAGGNLAAVITLLARERGGPHPLFQVLIYPMLDASTMRPSWFAESEAPIVTREVKHSLLSAYLPITTRLSDPHVSPIRAHTLANLPPALVIAYGDKDPMRAESEDYARRLTQDGVAATVSLYPSAIHGFFLMAGDLAAGRKCIDEVATTVRNAFNSTPTGSSLNDVPRSIPRN
jgi:acetyl esterase